MLDNWILFLKCIRYWELIKHGIISGDDLRKSMGLPPNKTGTLTTSILR